MPAPQRINLPPGSVAITVKNLPELSEKEKFEFAKRNGNGGLEVIPEPCSTPGTDSADSNFDWEETTVGSEDEGETRYDKTRSFWHKLSKLSQLLIFFAIGLIISIPAIIIGALGLFKDNQIARNNILIWFIWIGFLIVIGAVFHFVVDLIPWQVVTFSVWFTGACSEITKNRLEYFIAISRWIKLVIVVSFSWGIFAFLINIPFSDEYKEGEGTGGINYFNTIIKLNTALWASSLVILLQKFCVQLMAIRFHRVALYDRIKQNKKALWALDRLSKVKKHKTFKDRNVLGSTPLSRRNSLDHVKPQSRSTSPSEISQRPRMRSRQSSYQIEQTGKHHNHNAKDIDNKKSPKKILPKNIAHNLTKALQQVTLKSGRSQEEQDISSGLNAKKLARRLFQSLQGNRKYLIPQDFEPYFPTAQQAREAFALFDKDNNQDISRREMREATLRIYRERKALSQSLRDLSTVTGKLDKIFFFIALIIILFIFVGFFATNVVSSLVPVSTFLVAFSFIFGSTLRNLFESIVFIFFSHVCDAGDLISFDNNNYVVHNMGLMSTVLRRVDGQEMYIPNTVLAQKEIHNFRRSPSQAEVIPIDVYFYTPHEKISELRRRLREWGTENQREFDSDIPIHLFHLKGNALTLNVILVHKTNWNDWDERWNRRTRFVEALRDFCYEVGIELVTPTQSITMVEPSQQLYTQNTTSPIDPNKCPSRQHSRR